MSALRGNDNNAFLKDPIIFIGTGRSGTTIISEMLFQHEDLAWPSNYQEKVPTIPSINLLRGLFDNRFWRLIGKKKGLYGSAFYNKFLFEPGENYAMWQYLVGNEIDFSRGFLLDEKASPERREFIRGYFTQMVKAQGKKRLAFKITGPPRMGFLLSIFPDAIFVQINRNTIPTISSLLKVNFWRTQGRTRLWWTGPYDTAEEDWARENRDNPELMTAFQLKKIHWAEQTEAARYQPRILAVKYEDFTADPLREIKRILDYCGLAFDTRISKYLSANPVVPRNKPKEAYFSKELLKQIDELMKREATD